MASHFPRRSPSLSLALSLRLLGGQCYTINLLTINYYTINLLQLGKLVGTFGSRIVGCQVLSFACTAITYSVSTVTCIFSKLTCTLVTFLELDLCSLLCAL